MQCLNISALASGAAVLLWTGAAAAEEGRAFSWEGTFELGYVSTYDSDVPGNETDNPYGVLDLDATYAISPSVTAFAGLTFEEVEDAAGNIGYGAYIPELGLEFAAGPATVRLGKIHPTFGSAWDVAAGYYGSTLAEDYELTEQIGGMADFDLGGGSTVSVGLFFADTTVLSESAGFNRGRNTSASGGAGNTGRLDNLSLQWTQEMNATSFYLGARYLSASTGDVSDETGVVAGLSHSFEEAGVPLDLFVEIARFDGYGGTADDATYATLNAAWNIGDLTLSGTWSQRDVTSTGVTELVSVAAEYEWENGVFLGGALAHKDDAGVTDQLFAVQLIFPLGG